MVPRRFAPAAVLLAALAPPLAHAQVNIDQSKTPAQIYESDCAVCHKSMRGLANGRGGSALAGFLSEHYTSSEQEAAALAAYVLAGGGGNGTAALPRGQRPEPDHVRASAEEPKSREARRPAKPEETPTTGTRSRRPSREGAKPEGERSAVSEPGPADSAQRPPAGRHEPNTVTRTHGRPKPAEAAPQPAEAPPPARATVVATPNSPEAPSPDASPTATPGPSAAAPADAGPGEGAPVPRDNIPD